MPPLTGSDRIGFAGLGNLGMPMARHLVDKGWPVLAYDMAAEKVRDCAGKGAASADDPLDMSSCRLVALAVPDDAAVDDTLERGGLLDALEPGSVVVVHSTVLPGTVQRLAARATAAGIDLIDAPVSGGAERAREGTLTLMAGGTESAVRAARVYLDAVASTVVHVGPAGSGAVAKLANQLMMFASLAGVYEALDIAAAHGVGAADVLEAVRTSTGDSWVARHWGFFDEVSRAYDATQVPVGNRPWSKDLREVVTVAEAAEVTAPVAHLLAQGLAQRVEAHAARTADRGQA